ncbi:MAG: (2Fe-2S) ferredoxin domain-containing protein [Bacteroidales bacterium]|nr:(2Fe-2S) ferredoxin domain-containing protein [Bacteroidales bacterium]
MKKPDEIRICLGSSCFARGNKDIVEELNSFLEKHHLRDKLVIKGSHCLGNCQKGPNISFNDDIIGDIKKGNIEMILKDRPGINI